MSERLTQEQIKEIIPHREPFLFIETVEDVEYGVKISGTMIDWTKNPLIGNHDFPRTLMIEPLAQLGAVAVLGLPENRGKIGLLAKVDDFKIKGDFEPGCEVHLEAEIINLRSSYGKGKVKASVGKNVKAEGVISFGIGNSAQLQMSR